MAHWLVITLLLPAAAVVRGDVNVYRHEIVEVELASYRSLPASFGRILPDNGMAGVLTLAEPEDGCKAIRPAYIPGHAHDTIVLIERGGGCNFEDKVRHAQTANYSAVIVYNNLSDKLIPMGGSDKNLIPSVFIGLTDAANIKLHYLWSTDPRITVKLVDENSPFDFTSYLIPFCVVLGVCFLTMLAIVLCRGVNEYRESRRHRLPKSDLKKIPTIKFKAGDPYETCAICLEDFAEGEKLRILLCDHGYHTKCIDKWLLKNKRICPQCRKRVFPRRPDSEDDSADESSPLLGPSTSSAANSGTFSSLNETFSGRGGSTSAMRRMQEAIHQRRMEQAAQARRERGAAVASTSSMPSTVPSDLAMPSTSTGRSASRERRPRRPHRNRPGRRQRRQEDEEPLVSEQADGEHGQSQAPVFGPAEANVVTAAVVVHSVGGEGDAEEIPAVVTVDGAVGAGYSEPRIEDAEKEDSVA